MYYLFTFINYFNKSKQIYTFTWMFVCEMYNLFIIIIIINTKKYILKNVSNQIVLVTFDIYCTDGKKHHHLCCT